MFTNFLTVIFTRNSNKLTIFASYLISTTTANEHKMKQNEEKTNDIIQLIK